MVRDIHVYCLTALVTRSGVEHFPLEKLIVKINCMIDYRHMYPNSRLMMPHPPLYQHKENDRLHESVARCLSGLGPDVKQRATECRYVVH